MYVRQVAALVIGAVLPWLGNVMYLAGVGPWSDLDVTPGVFALSGIALAFGLYRYQALGRVPLAHDVLFGLTNDGLVVLMTDVDR